jgi:hypothetical protein
MEKGAERYQCKVFTVIKHHAVKNYRAMELQPFALLNLDIIAFLLVE